MIKRFAVDGFKCLRRFDQELTPFTVLVGPNDSGKTSVLEAVRVLSSTTTAGLDTVFQGEQRFESLCWRGAREGGITWEVELGGFLGEAGSYRLELGSTGGIPWVVSEKVNLSGFSAFGANNSRASGIAEYMKRTAVYDFAREQQNQTHTPTANALTKHLRSATVRLNASDIKRDSVVTDRPALDERGYGLASLLAAIKLADTARFQAIEAALQGAVPGIEQIGIDQVKVPVKEGQGVQHGYRIWVKLRGLDWKIPASAVSDGIMLFLAFLALIHSDDPPAVLLVEEPENGIHPRRLEVIIRTLRGLSEGLGSTPPVQVILTTHSPYLLDFAKPEEVLIMHRTSDGAANATRMSDTAQIAERRTELSLGEIWYNLGEEKLSPRGAP